MVHLSLLIALLALRSATATEVDPAVSPKCDASTFKHPVVAGAEVLSITAEERYNVSSAPWLNFLPAVSGIAFCDVKVYLTHPGADDRVLVETWLPLSHDSWNGRFQATGGGGHAVGFFDQFLAPAIETGYAASSTDGGHGPSPIDSSWVLKLDGSVNWPLVQNFAARSLADMVVVGKSVTEQYFGTAPHHSYWNGCSTGGRQGFILAQKYPDLLDGIYGFAPAVHMTHLLMGDFWPQVVMKEEGAFLSNCEFDFFREKAIEACDLLDGVKDGLIEDPEACMFDPATLVGTKALCEEKDVEITKSMAEVVRRVWQGPTTSFGHPIFHGYLHAASTRGVANIHIGEDGLRSQSPFAVSQTGIQNYLLKDSSFNTSTVTYADFMNLWAQFTEEFGWLLDTNDPNLAPFRDAGGKLLSWHGTGDELIPHQNSIQYRKRVEMEMGGPKAVNQFYRLFLTPGVGHCGGGNGPIPKDPLEKLVDWVEKGEPPERLEAETTDGVGERITRDLCLYPKKSKYIGIGDGRRASSWTCEGEDEELEEEERPESTGGFVGGLAERLRQVGLDMGFRIG